MATRFIGCAIELNGTIQQELFCSIHQGLLSQPITLPCLHRLCQDCLENWINISDSRRVPVRCPNCNASHKIPSDWKTRWFDRTLDTVARTAQSNESEVNKKIIQFVEESFTQFGRSDHMIKILSVSAVQNQQLKDRFENFKRQSQRNCDVITLLHGTTRESALSISREGFSIPTSFERGGAGPEGELKFGKAIYFAHAKKATEYGTDILVLTDCVLGRIWEKSAPHLQLTPDDIHRAGYNSIYFNSKQEGPANQEWAIYRVEQCLPLCIISYEIVDATEMNERELINKVKTMNYNSIDYQLLHQALFGTDNQCKAVLFFLGDSASKSPDQSSRLVSSLLSRMQPDQWKILFLHQNETIRILFLRALWHTGRHDQLLQYFFHSKIPMDLLLKSLQSSYTDVAWRTCGVLANMAACIVDVRKVLITTEVLAKLMELLRQSVANQGKICILTVTNLLANIGATEFSKLKQIRVLRDFINENLLDHDDEEIRDAGNRFFCNLIGRGSLTSDWVRAGYHDTAMAPDLGEN